MELRHIRYFIALAEELHFGRAAQRLCITQPPLSFNIQQLEKHLDAQLFVRDSRNVSLTPAGQAFLPEARRIIAQALRAAETVKAIVGGQTGRLQIGFTSSMLFRGMGELLGGFSARYPKIDVELYDMTIATQVDELAQGRIHAGFMPALAPPLGMETVKLGSDTYACCVPATHWAAQRNSLSLRELEHETFVLFARELTVSGHEYVLSMCVNAGFHPKAKHFVRQWLTAVAMVSSGFGVALMPASLQKASPPGVRFVRLEEAQPTDSFLAWNAEHAGPALQALVDHVRAAMQPAATLPLPRAA